MYNFTHRDVCIYKFVRSFGHRSAAVASATTSTAKGGGTSPLGSFFLSLHAVTCYCGGGGGGGGRLLLSLLSSKYLSWWYDRHCTRLDGDCSRTCRAPIPCPVFTGTVGSIRIIRSGGGCCIIFFNKARTVVIVTAAAFSASG